MGSAQSYMSLETAFTALVIAGAVGVGYKQLGHAPASTSLKDVITAPSKQEKRGKKKKQRHPQGDASDSEPHTTTQQPLPSTVPLPEVIPGQFDVNSASSELISADPADTASKAKKKKKKKGKAGTTGTPTDATPLPPNKSLSVDVDYISDSSAQNTQPTSAKRQQRNQQHAQQPSSSSSPLSRTLQLSTASLDTDGSWTRVGPRRNRGDASSQPQHDATLSAEPATSDAGVTTSATGNSSPVEERAEAADSFLLNAHISSSESGDNRRTLAEKLLPKPSKTGVDDMLEPSDYPSLSRVIRVQPLPNEKPALGFSWGDYEDVRVTTDGGENDADGEDDGWGVVRSKRSKIDRTMLSAPSAGPTTQQKAPETMTKRQRQNLQRKEKEKAAKVDAEVERQATLAKHKRELEKARMEEQYSKSGGGKTPSGGMKATVDERGKLVWE